MSKIHLLYVLDKTHGARLRIQEELYSVHYMLARMDYPNLRFERTDEDGLEDRLKEKEWDAIVIHLGDGNGFELAEKCRRASRHTFLIAESSVYPSDENTVKRYFDIYTNVQPDVKRLLSKGGIELEKG